MCRRFGASWRQFRPDDEIKRERVEPPRAGQAFGSSETVADTPSRSPDETPPPRFGLGRLSPSRRRDPHQSMQPDCFRCYRRITLIGDRLAVDQREGSQRCDRLVEPVAREVGGQWLPEPFAPFRKQGTAGSVRAQHAA